MKRLFIMRHAKSSRDEPTLGDHDRPLNERGERDAPRMGRRLKELGIQPDLVVSSTAERALRTAQLFADGNGYMREIKTDKHLYMAGVEDYLRVLSRLPGDLDDVLVVSHNPGSEELLEFLSGEPHVMRTCAVAVLELAGGSFDRHSAKLVLLETPPHKAE